MFWFGHKNGGMWINIPLGDLTEKALTLVGITHERVERWVGRPCGCAERKAKLNALGSWVSRIISGQTENASEYLDTLMTEEDKREAEKVKKGDKERV